MDKKMMFYHSHADCQRDLSRKIMDHAHSWGDESCCHSVIMGTNTYIAYMPIRHSQYNDQ